MKQIGHWLNNREVYASPERSGPVFNPATGEQTGQVAFASPEDVNRAVAGAVEAAAQWRETSLAQRTRIMFRFRELLDRNSEGLAKALTAEHGKVHSDALGEVARGIENVEFACGVSDLLKGEQSEQVSTGVDVSSVRQPLGVVAGITPFNFPAMVPLWMYPNAIACGNAFILKPSEKDPSVTLMVAELLAEAGLPEGVLTVLHGDQVAVDGLLEHPDIAAVSFVGSTPIAQSIYARATANGKRAQCLGGAKNHMVVLPDADLDLAADAAVGAAYGSAGERCMAVSVVAAVGDIGGPLVDAIRKRIGDIVVGDGSDPQSGMGPLITADHLGKVSGYLASAVEEGAEVVVDGRTAELPDRGFFLGPSLIDQVTPEMSAYTDEIFGPVLSMVHTETYPEAVKLIRDNPWGNGAAIFTRDGGAARDFVRHVDAGMVGVNVPIPVPVAAYSFGGWGQSLFGDLHAYGPDGIRFYTQTKVVTTRWPDPATSSVDLGFPQT